MISLDHEDISKNRLYKQLQKMLKLMHHFSDYGAEDTEPSVILAETLEKAFRETTIRIPSTPEEWQLFSGMPGVDHAAKSLAYKLKEILQRNYTLAEVAQVFRYFRWSVEVYRI